MLPKDLNPRLKNLIEGLLSKGKQHSTFWRITWQVHSSSGKIIKLAIFVILFNNNNWNSKSADPKQRMALADVAADSWVIGNDGPIPEYMCWCKRKNMERKDSEWEQAKYASMTWPLLTKSFTVGCICICWVETEVGLKEC